MWDWIIGVTLIASPFILGRILYRRYESKGVRDKLRRHFQPSPPQFIVVSQRRFPFRVRVDLQKAIEQTVRASTSVDFFCGIPKSMFEEISISGLLQSRTLPHSPQYEDVNVGEEEPVHCIQSGLWLLTDGNSKLAVLLSPAYRCGEATEIQVEVAAPQQDAVGISKRFFALLEDGVRKGASYRGKILSLEMTQSYTGQSCGILVHRLHAINRHQVILPQKTLDLLDRNVIQFVRQRSGLAHSKQAVKKGLLFYGPPGTGKTHTIHYLMSALQGHTTLLITADQVRLLGEYMTLARLLQPCMVVIEDVDLIGRNRTDMNTPTEQVLLNKLLNEMDGLTEDAEIMFILTTNRPETLEAALSSRPGRIDQAIEFPLPDAEGRAKLVRLYSDGIDLPEQFVPTIVRRTERVSAAFIKELIRRSVQFQLERASSGEIQLEDVEHALDEMLFSGGSLNLKLLGAEQVVEATNS